MDFNSDISQVINLNSLLKIAIAPLLPLSSNRSRKRFVNWNAVRLSWFIIDPAVLPQNGSKLCCSLKPGSIWLSPFQSSALRALSLAGPKSNLVIVPGVSLGASHGINPNTKPPVYFRGWWPSSRASPFPESDTKKPRVNRKVLWVWIRNKQPRDIFAPGLSLIKYSSSQPGLRRR